MSQPKVKIITTEKDYYRIKHYNIPEIKYLKIKSQQLLSNVKQ